jgi:hypothetical protein
MIGRSGWFAEERAPNSRPPLAFSLKASGGRLLIFPVRQHLAPAKRLTWRL